jgi:hypothetical protein
LRRESSTKTPLGGDSDADGVGNSCDNCPAAFNPTQSNLDFDGVGDMCDLDDGLIYVFAGDKTHIAWQGESLPTSWNVYEGDLAVLRATGIYTQPSGSNALANRRCGVTALAVDDTAAVPSGSVKFTLVTGHSRRRRDVARHDVPGRAAAQHESLSLGDEATRLQSYSGRFPAREGRDLVRGDDDGRAGFHATADPREHAASHRVVERFEADRRAGARAARRSSRRPTRPGAAVRGRDRAGSVARS